MDYLIPKNTKKGINNYVKHGIPPGGFLRAVLTNNLTESFGRADVNNRYALFSICQYIYNNIPASCWGSPEKVNAWIARKAEERTNTQNSQKP